MKLHSPEFERGLRRKVKEAVRASRSLKREYRVASRWRQPASLNRIGRPAISVAIGFFVWQIAERTQHPATALAAISLWGLLFVFIHAHGIYSCLYGASDLPALVLLPAHESTIFQWELQKFWRKSLMLLLDLLAGYVALAWCLEFSAVQWCAVLPLAVLTWGVVLAVAVFCAAHLPWIPFRFVSGSIITGLIALFLLRSYVGEAVLGLLERCAPGVNLCLPMGWPGLLAQLWLCQGQWLALALLLPIGGVLGTLRISLARFRAHYEFGEEVAMEAPDLLPEGHTEGEESADEEDLVRVGPTTIEQMVLTRSYLAAPLWSESGPLEAWLWRWLTPREKALSEFVFPNGYSVAGPWKKILRNGAIALLAGTAAGIASATAEYWILGIGLFITVCHALGQILNNGRAFQAVSCSGVNIPMYAGYGIGFRELAGLLFKCTLSHMPFFVPFCVVCSGFASYLLGLPIWPGALFGLKAAGLLAATRCIFVALAFSNGTNDSSAVRLRTMVLLLIILGGGGMFLLLGGASLFVPQAWAAWILWGGAGLDAYAFFKLYGWFYHRARFDLMSLPRE